IQEGLISSYSAARITYLNDAACGLFGLEAADPIGKPLDERIQGLDWESLTESGGPVSHDMEIFYPQNRFINFYIVPLVIEHREPATRIADSAPAPAALNDRDTPRSTKPAAPGAVGHVLRPRAVHQCRRS